MEAAVGEQVGAGGADEKRQAGSDGGEGWRATARVRRQRHWLGSGGAGEEAEQEGGCGARVDPE